jgi:hypothetical protein
MVEKDGHDEKSEPEATQYGLLDGLTTTCVILAGILGGCAVVAWGIQRVRGTRWHWFVEIGVMIGLLFAAGFGLRTFLPLILGE